MHSFSFPNLFLCLIETLHLAKVLELTNEDGNDFVRFHSKAFLHKGTASGNVNGTYLVNGTQIFLLGDEEGSGLSHVVGKQS